MAKLKGILLVLLTVIISITSFAQSKLRSQIDTPQPDSLPNYVKELPKASSNDTNNNDFTLSDYFYPFAVFNYKVTPHAKVSRLWKSYKLSRDGRQLIVETEIETGLLTFDAVNKTLYLLAEDKERNAIVSNTQIYYDGLRSETRKDHLTLFIIPPKDKPVSWYERHGSEEYCCKAKFVNLKVDSGNTRRAIRIERTTILDNKTQKKEKVWEYWLPNLSRIATFGQWGNDHSPITVVESSSIMDFEDDFKEIDEQLLRQYHEVVAGESIESIASKYDTTVDKLMKLNHLTSKKIRPKMIIRYK